MTDLQLLGLILLVCGTVAIIWWARKRIKRARSIEKVMREAWRRR